MAELAAALPQMRYIDVGLEVMVRTSLNQGDRARLGIKACCYTPACVRGHPEPARNGRPERSAPQCDAAQRAHAARMCYATRATRPAHTNFDKSADKRAGEEMRAHAARDTVEKAFRPPQECRAHEAGRCIKGDQCYESHNVPDSQITCCSVLKFGQKHYHKKYRTCTAFRVDKECPYSHEPLEEQTEEEMAEADLLDAQTLEEENEAAEIALAALAEQQSTEAALAEQQRAAAGTHD